MIQKKFIEETNKLINLCKERSIVLENGNVLVAKVKTETISKGGILLSQDHVDLEDYHQGLGRVVAVPRNLRITGEDNFPLDARLAVGDYVMHTHEARYKPYTPSMRTLFNFPVDDNLLYMVQDAEIHLTIPADVIHKDMGMNS